MKKILLLIMPCALVLAACSMNPEWDDYYAGQGGETAQSELIEELKGFKEISLFVKALQAYKVDTAFNSQGLYTVLAPSDEAYSLIPQSILEDSVQMRRLLLFHFIEGKKYYEDFSTGELITLSGKFLSVRFDSQNEVLWGDGARRIYSDRLINSGILHIVDKISFPKLNLYEYILSNPDLAGFKNYINSQVEKVFDRWHSEIVSYTPLGEPVYDSVFVEANTFLRRYPIDKDSTSFTFFAPDNLSQIEDQFSSAATYYGELPNGFFSKPIFDSLLINGSYANTDFKQIDKIKPEILFGAYGQKQLSNGYFHWTTNYDKKVSDLLEEKELEGKEVFDAAYKFGGNFRYEFYGSNVLLTNFISGSEGTDEVLGPVGTLIPESSPAYGRGVVINVRGPVFLPVKYKLFATVDLWSNYLGGYDFQVNDSTNIIHFDYPAQYLDNPTWEYSSATPGFGNHHEFELGEFTLDKVREYITIKISFVKRHESASRGFGGSDGAQWFLLKNIRIVPVLND